MIPIEIAILLGIWTLGCLLFVAFIYLLVHKANKPTHSNLWVGHFYEGLKEEDV